MRSMPILAGGQLDGGERRNVAAGSTPALGSDLQSAAWKGAIEALFRISFARSRQKRGPPTFFS